MDSSLSFQQSFVKYLEASHQGELYTDSVEQIKSYLSEQEIQDDYEIPTQILPIAPPYQCIYHSTYVEKCSAHVAYKKWQDKYHIVTDDILL